jgi:opacity protein-like surface antigen
MPRLVNSRRSFRTVFAPAVVTAMASCAATSNRSATAAGSAAREGWFVSALGVATTLEDDDFDGQSAVRFVGGSEATIMPEEEAGTGFGAAIGWRGERNSVQFTYTSTEHESESLITSGDDELRTYSLDCKHHFLVEHGFQPFVLVGITVPRLIVDGGTFDQATLTTQLGDAKYQGLGLNLGLGAAWYITDRIALVGEGFYRWAYFDQATGVEDDGDIRGQLDASGLAVRAGLSFTF